MGLLSYKKLSFIFKIIKCNFNNANLTNLLWIEKISTTATIFETKVKIEIHIKH